MRHVFRRHFFGGTRLFQTVTVRGPFIITVGIDGSIQVIISCTGRVTNGITVRIVDGGRVAVRVIGTHAVKNGRMELGLRVVTGLPRVGIIAANHGRGISTTHNRRLRDFFNMEKWHVIKEGWHTVWVEHGGLMRGGFGPL